MHANRSILLAAVFSSILASMSASVQAGDIYPPGAPGSTFKTLDEIEPGTPITSLPASGTALHVISEPGRYYLTEILIGTTGLHGIEIASDNVTIDLKGFALIGVAGSLNGVDDGYASTSIQRTCIRIAGGTIRDWGGRGVNLGGSAGSILDYLLVTNNGAHGIVANAPSIIESCNVTYNGGNGIQASHDRIVRNCGARHNGGHGIYLASGGLVENCVASHNGGDGLNIEFGGTTDAVGRITDCVSRHNTGRGIWCEGGANISGCTVYTNSGGGIDAPSSLVRGNVVRGNTGFGVQGVGSTLIDNHVQ